MKYKHVIISRFGSAEVLKVIEEDSLPEPKPREVRVKVLVAGVSFTDVMIRKGKYPNVKEKPPFTPGYDLVGIVDKLGQGSTHFKVGELVADLMVIGAYSEYVCVPESSLTPVPSTIEPAEAVTLVLSYVTAYQMLHRIAKIKNGQRILIHGAGGAVGTAMIQLGNLLELEIYGTASHAKHKLIKSLGATPIDYQTEDFVQRLKSITGNGVDAVFDPIGGDHLKRSFEVLRPHGILVSYGFYNAVIGKSGSIPLDFVKLKLWDMLPNRRSTTFYSIEALRQKQPNWFTEDLSTLLNLLEEEKIKPIICQRLPMSEVRQAHELIESAKVQGKIVLDIGQRQANQDQNS